MQTSKCTLFYIVHLQCTTYNIEQVSGKTSQALTFLCLIINELEDICSLFISVHYC
jgi:hypothetical protein